MRASLLDAETRFTIGRWNVRTMSLLSFKNNAGLPRNAELQALYISSGSVNSAKVGRL